MVDWMFQGCRGNRKKCRIVSDSVGLKKEANSIAGQRIGFTSQTSARSRDSSLERTQPKGYSEDNASIGRITPCELLVG
jgi:hypothetical protein